MLDDRDRIFTNVYGFHDWGIDGALKRGDWDGTKALMARGQDRIIEDIKASGLRRARRCRLPDRHEVELHAQGT